MTPAATDTFRLLTAPAIGIDTIRSHRSRTRRRSPVPSAPSTIAVGSVQVAARRSARAPSPSRPDRPDARRLQFVDRARDVHHGRDAHVRERAGRGLARPRRRATPRGASAGRRRARRRHRGPQNRADVVRILDPVEHDEQRRLLARGRDQILDRVAPRRPSTSATTSWCTPPRARRCSTAASTRSTGTPISPRQRQRLIDAPVGPRARRASRCTRPLRSASRTGLRP